MNQDQAPEWWFVSARGLHHALGCRCGLGDQLGDGLFAVVRHLSIMAERIVPDHGSEQSDLPVHPPLHEVGRS